MVFLSSEVGDFLYLPYDLNTLYLDENRDHPFQQQIWMHQVSCTNLTPGDISPY